MKIIELYNNKTPVLSFEIFPPKPDSPIEKIYSSIESFKRLKPDFISVTYGAGGSTKTGTIEISSKIKNLHSLECMAHLTCVGHDMFEINSLLDLLNQNNIENVLALRGDPPTGQPGYSFEKNAYCHANDLISHIKKRTNFCIGAAAYVEGHAECKNIRIDLQNHKRKAEAGTDFFITQLFFDNRRYFDFVDRLQSMNVSCPIIPGIMPIFKSYQIKTITAKSGCSIPATLVLMMDKYERNPDDLKKAGIEYAANQINNLVENGAPGIHLYTMNRPLSTRLILENSNL